MRNHSGHTVPVLRNRGRCHFEDGNTTVLTIGLLAVIGLVLAVVINSSAVFLQHRDLMNEADAAALRAADAVDEADYFSHRDPKRVRLDPAEARAVAGLGLAKGTAVTLRVADARVYVRLERPYTLPIRPPGMRHTTTIVAESDAQILSFSR